ncbi:MAG: hypothetical protein C0501_22480 [Isosphaera sp.]|nr:hypothetical protein [Isosphaera sp.]
MGADDKNRQGSTGTGRDAGGRPVDQSGVEKPETTGAEEWGERLDTGKTIARGGKTDGPVPGAEPSSGTGEEP